MLAKSDHAPVFQSKSKGLFVLNIQLLPFEEAVRGDQAAMFYGLAVGLTHCQRFSFGVDG